MSGFLEDMKRVYASGGKAESEIRFGIGGETRLTVAPRQIIQFLSVQSLVNGDSFGHEVVNAWLPNEDDLIIKGD